MKRTYLLPVAVLLSGALAGCGQGTNANTTIQDETGNGIVIEAGTMTVASATIVAGDEGSGRGAVSAVIVNGGTEAETLDAITVAGDDAELTPSEVIIEPGASVQVATTGEVQAEADLDTPAGEYVDIAFVFSDSGIAAELVLVVPPVGYYEDFAPVGSTGESAAEGEEADAEGEEADAGVEGVAEGEAATEGEEAEATQ